MDGCYGEIPGRWIDGTVNGVARWVTQGCDWARAAVLILNDGVIVVVNNKDIAFLIGADAVWLVKARQRSHQLILRI